MSTDQHWPERPAGPPSIGEMPLPPPPTPGQVSLTGALLDPPDVVPAAAAVVRSSRVGQLVALALGLVFLGGIGALAMGGFGAGRSGESSPEAAVEALTAALDREDVVAALEVMAPSEVGTASELYPRIIEFAVEEGELASTDWLAGVDFTVTGLKTRTTQLHADVALVELVSGTIEVTVDPDVADPMFTTGELQVRVTIEELLQEMEEAMAGGTDPLDAPGSQQLAEMTTFLPWSVPFDATAPQGIFIMTVKRDGGWYVSPFYTLAEYGRQILDLPSADFSASREDAHPGADSAAAVVQDLVDMVNGRRLEDHVDAALDGDPDDTFAPLWVLVPPDEAGVFLDYAPSYTALFERIFSGSELSMDDLRDEFRQAADEADIRGQLTVQVTVDEEPLGGGPVALHLTSGSVRAEVSGIEPDTTERVSVTADASWDGLCGRAELTIEGAAPETVSDCVAIDDIPAGMDDVFVVVDEESGGWYISYVETALAYADLYLAD